MDTKIREVAGALCEVSDALLEQRPKVKPTVTERFWSKVVKSPETGCWNWTGSKNYRGYGWFRYRGRCEKAHRVAWRLFRGPIPLGVDVLHKCNHAACVNPEHLYLGNDADNMRDCMRAGNLGPAKLTPIAVLTIRGLHGRGLKKKEVAEMFSVSRQTVQRIWHRRAWACL